LGSQSETQKFTQDIKNWLRSSRYKIKNAKKKKKKKKKKNFKKFLLNLKSGPDNGSFRE